MYQSILVPVDGSPTSIRGVDEAIRLAKLTGGRIHLVHVLDQLAFVAGLEMSTIDIFGILQQEGSEILKQMKARVEASGVPATTFISEPLPGRVCDVVAAQAKVVHADLIIVGTHGRRGVGRMFLGSDAEQILRTSSVPVLVVRGQAAEEQARSPAPAELRAAP
jgi:nucleotide-binding universal stress UspA family protein